VAKAPLAGDHVGAWRTRHQAPCVVGHQGCVLLLHSTMPMWVSEGGSDGGGDRTCVQRSGGRISGQNQPVDGAKNAGCASSHHRLDMLGVAVDGDRVIHMQLRADYRDNGGHGCGRLATVIDDDGVNKASRARRWARVHGCQGSGVPAAVVDKGGIGEVSCARRRGYAWCGRSRQGRVCRGKRCTRRRRSRAWHMRARRGRTRHGKRRTRRHRSCAWRGQRRKAGRLGWRGNLIGLKE
jgi:hypothetical protein